MSQNPFEALAAEAPEVNKAFFDLIGALMSNGGLDAKTFQLIYIGIKATQGQVGSVAAHTAIAKKEGATREEIRDTILLSLMVCGVDGIASCLVPALEAYDQA
jgi:AhpD family alkylhydroperoxidase